MTNPICTTCGTQYPDAPAPDVCAICADERQYVGWDGQQWTDMERLAARHALTLKELEPGLLGITLRPSFAIGQRPLVVRSPGGNVMWDCTSLVDDQIVRAIGAFGGVSAIAISHPHFYGSMVDWSRALGDVPILLPRVDSAHVMRPDPAIRLWEGDGVDLWDGIRVVRCGGHFAGSSVLLWPAGADGRGAVLAGDTIAVAADRRWVSFMRSFPNIIPLGPRALAGIETALAPLTFDRIYGAWDGDVVARDARGAVMRSIERYRRAIAD